MNRRKTSFCSGSGKTPVGFLTCGRGQPPAGLLLHLLKDTNTLSCSAIASLGHQRGEEGGPAVNRVNSGGSDKHAHKHTTKEKPLPRKKSDQFLPWFM